MIAGVVTAMATAMHQVAETIPTIITATKSTNIAAGNDYYTSRKKPLKSRRGNINADRDLGDNTFRHRAKGRNISEGSILHTQVSKVSNATKTIVPLIF